MNPAILLLVTITHLIASPACSAQETRLLGTWKSDKEATKRYITSELKLSPTVIEALDKIVGTLTLTYTSSTVTFANCELAGTYRYEVLASSDKELKVQIIGTNGERSSISTIQFTSPTEFWSIPSKSEIPGFRELFRKTDEKTNP
jgi:hypothetical protein